MNPEGSVGYMEKKVVNGLCTDGHKNCPGWAPKYCASKYVLNGKKIKNLCRKSCGKCVDANLGMY